MAQFRGRQTTVVHLRLVNRLSVVGNVEITGKSHEIGKLAAIGKLDSHSPISRDSRRRRYFEDCVARCGVDCSQL